MRDELWRKAQPGSYTCKIDPFGLILVLGLSFVQRLSGLREMTERFSQSLRTANFSSLSFAIRRRSSLDLIRRMASALEFAPRHRRNALIAIDAMAISLPKTQSHHCKKLNNKTVGCGVLWAFALDAARGVNPLQILCTMHGAWRDTKVMETVALVARGPIYLMDRGFFAFALIERLLHERVHFIMRMCKASAEHRLVIREISAPRRIGHKRLVLDAWVRLGGPASKRHPCLRLVMAVLPGGGDLYLLTDRQDLSAETILKMYKRRWEIESFHRLLKDFLGFAHLYSFHATGIEFLLWTAWLLTVMLYLSSLPSSGRTLDALRKAIGQLRAAMGVAGIWRRNSCIRPRSAKKRNNAKNL